MVSAVSNVAFSAVLRASRIAALRSLSGRTLLLATLITMMLIFIAPIGPDALLPAAFSTEGMPLRAAPGGDTGPIATATLKVFFYNFLPYNT